MEINMIIKEKEFKSKKSYIEYSDDSFTE